MALTREADAPRRSNPIEWTSKIDFPGQSR
jgi:hypothetical protein